MNNNKEYLEKDIKKHKPKLFLPIFNTIIGIAFIVLMVRVTIYNNVSVWYLILVIILVLIFIGGTWFTQFFFRMRNKNLTKDFENETDLLFKAIYELKKGTFIEPKNPVKVEITEEYANVPKVNYEKIDKCFKPKDPIDIFVNIGPSCAGLLFDYNHLNVKGFQGMSPNSIWKNKRITLPTSKKGGLKINMDDYSKMKKLTLKILNQTDLYYDSRNGIYLTGEYTKTPLDENIQIGENVIVTVFEEEIKSVYVILEPKLLKETKENKHKNKIKG